VPGKRLEIFFSGGCQDESSKNSIPIVRNVELRPEKLPWIFLNRLLPGDQDL